jgi:hypothetical protein
MGQDSANGEDGTTLTPDAVDIDAMPPPEDERRRAGSTANHSY